MNFNELGLDPSLTAALEAESIVSPTQIQEAVIPLILNGGDLAAQSETGTGKTLAFLLPIFQTIDLSIKNNQALILAPTHELAIQIHDQAVRLSQNAGEIKSMLAIGNVSIKRQIEKLKKKPQLVVGSPGRIADLIAQKKIKPHTIKTIVVDEADSLLQGENHQVIRGIINTTQRDRQLLFFSATISEKAMQLIRDLAAAVERVSIKNSAVITHDIDHLFFDVPDARDKIKVLRKAFYALKVERAIVFIHKNMDVAMLKERLAYHHIKTADLHSCNTKQERQKALEDFRHGQIQLLIASDIAARGLDVKDVSHIFNLDIPSDAQNYRHRVGRTGRAGMKGTAVSIVSGKETYLIDRFEKDLGISIAKKTLREGMVVDEQ